MCVRPDAGQEACGECASRGCGVGDRNDAEIAARTPHREVTIGRDVAEADDRAGARPRH
jgi:hypothetical protein